KGVLLHNIALPSGERGFEDVTEKYGLDFRDLASVLFADLNNDGLMDIVLGRYASMSEIYFGVKAGDDLRFIPGRVDKAGILPANVSAIAAADVNDDGYLDLFFATADQDYHTSNLIPRDSSTDRVGPKNVLLIN